ncbi:hypothetical protein RJ640_029432 [Escallonia rubra]|uniref:Uncharacterized protein n=1 Tax=Escallonia rubra TaxID=112253 RepID=A0AA88UN12_9ASTE|nr:hypothetical protein RJ640_029432 [Escallonia rubra]
MLDDWMIKLTSWVCKSGEGDKELMRRGVAGIVVAFIRAFLQGDREELNAIVKSSGVAPIQLDPEQIPKELTSKFDTILAN